MESEKKAIAETIYDKNRWMITQFRRLIFVRGHTDREKS